MRRENFLKLDAGSALTAGTVLGWNQLALQAVRNAQLGPLQATHALAVLHTCMYNAWAAYDDRARQTAHGVAVRLPRPERSAASKAGAMSHAAHGLLMERFPAQRAAFDAWLAGLGQDPAAGDPAAGDPAAGYDPLSPAGVGRSQAAAMRDYCRRGGIDRLGGLVGGAAEARRDAGLDNRSPVVEPAPGRWFLPAHFLSEHDGNSDDQDVRLFFALANALADAGLLAVQGCSGAATAEVFRRFEGKMRGEPRFRTTGSAGEELGRLAGARAFDGARRYWDGKF
jgi:hypothetical protein